MDLLGTGVDAVIFDTDGVITDTASVHAAAWKRLFDDHLRERAGRSGGSFEPFDADRDYRRYVDGKPRYDGVRAFLDSRGIDIPWGDPADPPDRETVCGLGNLKNGYFLDHLQEFGADPYPSTVGFVRELRARGVKTGVISASRNMRQVLEAAGVADLFDVMVDGVVAEELGLPGKPDPAVFLQAARLLGVEPSRAAVVEDALAGVEAGKRGRFGLVIGVDRTGHADELAAAGADVVVGDLGELEPLGTETPVEGNDIRDLPVALDHGDELRRMVSERRPAVFLDYDGTLTPIVGRPEDAALPPRTRAAIERLAALAPVAILSGRDLQDVRRMVGIDGITYAGSHGFDLVRVDGSVHQRGREFLPDLDAAERELGPRLEGIPGARVERKAFAIAVHFRQADDDRVPEIDAAVAEVAAEHPRLRRTGGKKIFELRPDFDWDKGRALRSLLEEPGLAGDDVLPIYVGDDETDEDAFRAIGDGGLGLVVRGERDARPTSARYALRNTEETRAFLELLGDAMLGEGSV